LDEALLSRIDHLVYATPDFEATVAALEDRLGARATPGGQHPGRGTRNAIFSLGLRAYLEVIGPDHAQPVPDKPRWFDIDALVEPRLVGWAVKGSKLTELVAASSRRGVHLGAVVTGGRQRPDGIWLRWQLTDPATVVADGVAPFFIDWGSSPHPAQTGTPGLTLVDLRAEHPNVEETRRVLSVLGLDLTIDRAPRHALIATLEGANGRLELR
jgi:hypothetical protein